VLGRDFQMTPGGKGANQAYAAGRLAHGPLTVRMIGRVGYDLFADHLRASLSAAGVDVSGVHATRSAPTGVALIWVDRTGQNSIVVASGANHSLLASEMASFRSQFEGARLALFQLETPLPTVEAAMRLAREEGARTILDPAPATKLPPALLAEVDILTPNEAEASILLGRTPGPLSLEEAPGVAAALRQLGPQAVILKLGEKGCFCLDDAGERYCPCFPVTAVDSTAAGDTFNGALAVALAEDQPIPDALRFANAAAALSVTRAGAQASIPSRDEVERLFSR
jgi:ribokinase